jgi:hypothetical protein
MRPGSLSSTSRAYADIVADTSGGNRSGFDEFIGHLACTE